MIDALEYCKQHDKPVTVQNIEKLKSFAESEIIAETAFPEEDNCTEHQTETQSWIKVSEIYFKVPLSVLIKHSLGFFCKHYVPTKLRVNLRFSGGVSF